MHWPAAWPNASVMESWEAHDGISLPFPGVWAGGPLAAGTEFPGYFVDGEASRRRDCHVAQLTVQLLHERLSCCRTVN